MAKKIEIINDYYALYKSFYIVTIIVTFTNNKTMSNTSFETAYPNIGKYFDDNDDNYYDFSPQKPTIESVLNEICKYFNEESETTMDIYKFKLFKNSLNIKSKSWYANEATITIIELTEKNYGVNITSGNHNVKLTIKNLDEIKTCINTIYVLFRVGQISSSVSIQMNSMDCIMFKGYCDVIKCKNLKDGDWKMFNNSTIIGNKIGNNSVSSRINQLYSR